ncbi:hypothetical protein BJY01DRAFT_68000 [Aspergillus pseudoustus]|uniref:Uncharacterized protein n=1 Tax=Aspergillus pseudoustus TaxID=1810923 RepID=A0ABR4J6R9_9EURO
MVNQPNSGTPSSSPRTLPKNPSQRNIRVDHFASQNNTTTTFSSFSSDFSLLDDFAQLISLTFSALIGCCVLELGSMLREELLRSKQDEIARCLLSRKRKLSELYFATVGYAGATENPFADSVYQEKEQAFLDANDITK